MGQTLVLPLQWKLDTARSLFFLDTGKDMTMSRIADELSAMWADLLRLAPGNIQVIFSQFSWSWRDYSRIAFTWNHGQGLKMIRETKLLQQSLVYSEWFRYCYLSVDLLFNSPLARQVRNKLKFNSATLSTRATALDPFLLTQEWLLQLSFQQFSHQCKVLSLTAWFK